MSRVLSMRACGGRVPAGAVYIGRPSAWGNPFVLRRGAGLAERAECIRRYSVWVRAELAAGRLDLRALVGRDLVCFCAPLPCHGDVLLELLAAAGL